MSDGIKPPASMMPTIMSQVNDAVTKMEPKQRLGALIALETKKGLYFGVVGKLIDGKKVDVNGIGWISKKPGESVDAGVAVYLKIGD